MRMDTLQPDRCEIRGENFTGKVTPWSLVLVTGVRPVAVAIVPERVN